MFCSNRKKVSGATCLIISIKIGLKPFALISMLQPLKDTAAPRSPTLAVAPTGHATPSAVTAVAAASPKDSATTSTPSMGSSRMYLAFGVERSGHPSSMRLKFDLPNSTKMETVSSGEPPR